MSSIEWTDETWNPTVGCTRLSGGCDNCYAIGVARRFKDEFPHYAGLTVGRASSSSGQVDWTGNIAVAPKHILNKPVRQKRSTVYFVNSMSDLFHDRVNDADLLSIFQVMNECDRHVFQVLSKRPSRMAKKTAELGLRWTDNIWAGTSIEQNKHAKPRSRELLKVPAAIRFVSAEPLLEALPDLPVSDLDWVIAGGDPGRAKTVRAMKGDWACDLRDRCAAAKTPFFFKQWGEHDEAGRRVGKKVSGHLLDGEQVFQMPAAAYDRLSDHGRAMGNRWVRIEKEAKPTPSKRVEAFPPPYVVGGRPSHDLTQCSSSDHLGHLAA